MMLQTLECVQVYLHEHELSDTASLDMDTAYLWFVGTHRSDEFQKKIEERHQVLLDFCNQTDTDVTNINDYDTIYELYYLLNADDITKEKIPEYNISVERLEETISDRYHEEPSLYGCQNLAQNYLPSNEHFLRPLYHSFQEKAEQDSLDELLALEHEQEKEYEMLKPMLDRFFPAA